MENAIFAAGAKAVGMVKSSLAAAVGSGLKINSPRACMIVDIGGGMTQIAVISSGGVVRSRAVKLAGDKLDGAIINNLRSKKDLFVGEVTAEMIKVRIGSALPQIDRGMLDVSGRNERLKCAQTIRVTSEDVYNATHAALEAICRAITATLESTPPEIAGDITDYGIMLVGGGANIHGIAELINQKTRLRVTVAQNPMDCECLGLGRLIERPSIIPGGIIYKNR
jgi:rod shape-determining protein MreB